MSRFEKAFMLGLGLATGISCTRAPDFYSSKYQTNYKGKTGDQIPTPPPAPPTQDIVVPPQAKPLSDAEVLELIDESVSKLNPQEAPKTRFFTLHMVNNLGVKAAELEMQRQAFKKVLNSLSTKSALVNPTPVDASKLIYRVNLDDLGISAAEFDGVIADHYPFNIRFQDIGSSESIANEVKDESIRKLLATETPLIRMDWWNATATLPILYAKLMRFPDNLADFEAQFLGNGNQRIANIEADDVLRSGFDNSKEALGNRIIERHEGRNGGYYVAYDFIRLKLGDNFVNAQGQNRVANQADVDAHNINKAPLGPLGTNANNDDLEFAQDQIEVIFTLANGLLGFYMADVQGQAIDKSPTNIVQNVNGPSEFSLAIANGQSCMSCHNSGLLLTPDTVLQGIGVNKQFFDAADISRINRLYQPNVFRSEVDQDNANFLQTMKDMGIDPTKPDPVDGAFRFYNRPMTRKDVITELGLSERDLNLLLFDPEFSGQLNALNNPEGTVSRALFQSIYPGAIAKFKQENQIQTPQEADFVVDADCMADDQTQMDTCVIAPVQ